MKKFSSISSYVVNKHKITGKPLQYVCTYIVLHCSHNIPKLGRAKIGIQGKKIADHQCYDS